MVAINFLITISIVGVVGWAIRTVVNDRLTRNRTSDSAFNSAVTEFVAAFSVALSDLRAGDSDTYILQEHLPIHRKAMEKFVLNLSGGTERQFREAWQRYEDHENLWGQA
jgi:hypothetical protein